MKSVLLVARITFIYNLCFLIAVVLRYFDFIPDRELKSMIIVSGYILSCVCNIALHVLIAAVLIKDKSFAPLRPAWLFIANTALFIFQLYFITR